MTRTLSIASGKGGVGKTALTVNLAVSLAALGRRVLILDADFGLANVDVALGLTPRRTIEDVIQGRVSIEKVLVPGPLGISVIPASSGIQALSNLSAAQQLHLMNAIEEMTDHFDYLLVDTAAGISSNVTFFTAAASEILCVVTPDPTSLTDAYALIKVLSQQYGEDRINVVCNLVDGEDQGRKVFSQLLRVTDRFLRCKLNYMGSLPRDEALVSAVRSQQPVVIESPSSNAARSLTRLAAVIDQDFWEMRTKGGMQFLFGQLMEGAVYGG